MGPIDIEQLEEKLSRALGVADVLAEHDLARDEYHFWLARDGDPDGCVRWARYGAHELSSGSASDYALYLQVAHTIPRHCTPHQRFAARVRTAFGIALDVYGVYGDEYIRNRIGRAMTEAGLDTKPNLAFTMREHRKYAGLVEREVAAMLKERWQPAVDMRHKSDLEPGTEWERLQHAVATVNELSAAQGAYWFLGPDEKLAVAKYGKPAPIQLPPPAGYAKGGVIAQPPVAFEAGDRPAVKIAKTVCDCGGPPSHVPGGIWCRRS